MGREVNANASPASFHSPSLLQAMTWKPVTPRGQIGVVGKPPRASLDPVVVETLELVFESHLLRATRLSAV